MSAEMIGAAAPPEQVASGLQRIINDSTGSKEVPGITIQVVTPNWSWSSAAGNAGLNSSDPAEPGMLFRVASVSKVFTATAVCKLAEEGKLNLNDSIDRWLPQKYLDRIQDHSNITLRMLLQHRSGIADYDEEESLIPMQLSQPETPVSTDTAIFQGLDKGLLFKPDTNYTYSNVGYLLLTRVIDEASGMSYEDYVRKTLIKPLGLNDTIMPTSPPIKTIPGKYMHCEVYVNDSSVYNFSDIYILWDRGAGDIICSAEDLNKFHKALREGRVLGPGLIREMQDFKPTLANSTDKEYGLGYGISKYHNGSFNYSLIGHAGAYPASITAFYYWVEGDTYIAFNMNSIRLDVMYSILRQIIEYLGGHAPS
ncbi:MAG TPA: serine hydrolase domain-containing protein [Methanotrichaceae archaeon]|nr:serine hydrolase domain-containing protein [Methanotrichaceae archaeon]